MKKLLNTLLCLMLSLALVLSFAACSKDKDDKKEDEETSKSDTVKDEKEDEEPAEDEKPADEEDEELVEDEDDAEAKVKAVVNKYNEEVGDEYTTFKAEGTKVVITSEAPEGTTEEEAESVYESMDDIGPEMLKELQGEEPAVTAIQVILILDGEEVYSKEFK